MLSLRKRCGTESSVTERKKSHRRDRLLETAPEDTDVPTPFKCTTLNNSHLQTPQEQRFSPFPRKENKHLPVGLFCSGLPHCMANTEQKKRSKNKSCSFLGSAVHAGGMGLGLSTPSSRTAEGSKRPSAPCSCPGGTHLISTLILAFLPHTRSRSILPSGIPEDTTTVNKARLWAPTGKSVILRLSNPTCQAPRTGTRNPQKG